MSWIRHSSSRWWCSIADTTQHSYVTRCAGRMSVTEPHYLSDNPEDMERCGACRRELAKAELRESMTYRVRDFADAFDVGGEG